jgi:hypothetical protein
MAGVDGGGIALFAGLNSLHQYYISTSVAIV